MPTILPKMALVATTNVAGHFHNHVGARSGPSIPDCQTILRCNTHSLQRHELSMTIARFNWRACHARSWQFPLLPPEASEVMSTFRHLNFFPQTTTSLSVHTSPTHLLSTNPSPAISSMAEAKYYHSTLYQFTPEAYRDVVNRFYVSMQDVSARCWYDTEQDVSICLAC